MSPCRAAVLLFFAPLVLGAMIGVAIGNSLIVALEDAQRERRRGVTRVTRPSDMETAWLIRDSAEKGYVVERDAAEWSIN